MYAYDIHIYTCAISFFSIFCAFPITAAALHYSTSDPLAYFICIILCKYVSLHCAMHLKRFPRRRQILSFNGGAMRITLIF